MSAGGPGRVRVKYCGITRAQDAARAAALGVDAIGLVFHPPSPRRVDLDAARRVAAALPPFVTTVGLFVDAPRAEVEEVLAAVPLDLLQFHGEEPPEYCRGFGRPYVKAVRMRPGVDLHRVAARYAEAAALLLDTYRRDLPGGTGESFDWERVPGDLPLPVILAGGLKPGNVAEAIRRVRPYAVDVSGGIEREPGVKDPERMAAFMQEVMNAGYQAARA